MSSNMLKLNPDKTELIIFGSYAKLKKLDSHLPVWISVISVVSGLILIFAFTDNVHNICKTWLI